MPTLFDDVGSAVEHRVATGGQELCTQSPGRRSDVMSLSTNGRDRPDQGTALRPSRRGHLKPRLGMKTDGKVAPLRVPKNGGGRGVRKQQRGKSSDARGAGPRHGRDDGRKCPSERTPGPDRGTAWRRWAALSTNRNPHPKRRIRGGSPRVTSWCPAGPGRGGGRWGGPGPGVEHHERRAGGGHARRCRAGRRVEHGHGHHRGHHQLGQRCLRHFGREQRDQLE